MNGTSEGNGIWKSEGVARRFITAHTYRNRLRGNKIPSRLVGSPVAGFVVAGAHDGSPQLCKPRCLCNSDLCTVLQRALISAADVL